MSDCLESFRSSIDHVAATVAEYERQIISGEYGRSWIVTDESGEEHVVLDAGDESSAIELAFNLFGVRGDSAEHVQSDEPTIVDDDGNHESIEDWPLEVVVKVGRPLAVVISTGGPHIEIVQDLGGGSAKLAAYWTGHREFRHGPEFQTVLDYLTSYLWDEAPDQYK